MWFQHDGAAPHNAATAKGLLHRKFSGKWIGRGGPIPRPARSSDLNPLDFFFWGALKEKVYTGRHLMRGQEELAARLDVAITEITPEMVATVQANLRRARACIDAEDGGSKVAEITNKLLFMIAKNNLPYNTVEKEWFKLFMQTILPLYKIPTRKTITQLLDEKYEVLSNMIKSQLKQLSQLSLTTDIWTEPLNTKSYLGLTGHYILDNNHKSITIGVTELDERHSASNIEKWLKTIIKVWEINVESIIVIVSDSGSNIKKAIKDAFGAEKHLSCFAQSKPYSNKTDKLRDITELKLIQSVETRWNSTYNMLSRFIELSNKISSILLKLPHAPSMIKAFELHTVKKFVSLLKPFENATKIISGEKYLTASKVIPIVNTLKIKLIETISETEIGNEMKHLLLEKFQERFSNIENEKILTISTILDPRFKIVHFNNDAACTNSINEIVKLINEERSELTVENNTTNVNVTIGSGFWSYHESLVHRIRSERSLNVQENEIPQDLKYYLT
ncbi:E3 SUMO-protein ligase ZBED1-like [Prorops nasuta]|uniref:E3 SUMO-protein ligase ZBED1-like n=1 Tax=Prorops nasuta TaxID=863751 RepID=UPI0034D00509